MRSEKITRKTIYGFFTHCGTSSCTLVNVKKFYITDCKKSEMRNYCIKIQEKTRLQKGKFGTQKTCFYLTVFADLILKEKLWN